MSDKIGGNRWSLRQTPSPAPDPHRVLVDDLHAEIRRLRAELDRVEAELRQALWHLNPGPEATERDRTSPSGVESDSGSPDSGLSRLLSPAESPTRRNLQPPISGDSAAITVPTLPDAGPVTIVPGITVSPSIIRQRIQPGGDALGAGDLDDEI